MKMIAKLRGMTLVEVLVGVALFGIVSVGGIILMTEKKKAEITGNTEVLAAEIAEKFFEQRRKVFQTSYEDRSGNGSCRRLNVDGSGLASALLDPADVQCQLEFPTVRYPADPSNQIVPPAPTSLPFNNNGCQATEVPLIGFPGNTFRSVSIPSSGCFGGFRETITNVCDLGATNVPGLNFSGLSQCEQNLISNCAHQTCGGDINSYFRMRVRVDRLTGPSPDGQPGGLSTTVFPLNNQQGVIGAALCIVPNGGIDAVGADPRSAPNPYTGINFRLLLLVKDANNRVKLVRKETSFARPRLRLADSIFPSSIGCDKSQN